jgi:hypothetical protein
MVKWFLFAAFSGLDGLDKEAARAIIREHATFRAFLTEAECLDESAVLHERLRREVSGSISYSGTCSSFTREMAAEWGATPENLDLWFDGGAEL